MTAGGCVCHRAELGRWLIPGLNLRRPHMTSLWEYVCQGWERRLEGGGSDFRIQAGNTKYIYESQADIHHMTPVTLPVQKSGFGHKKLYLTPCSVQAMVAERDTRNGGEGGGASHATSLCLPKCQQNQSTRDSLVVQWLRIHLPMQGTQVQSLVQEDPISHGVTKPMRRNY